MTVSVQSSETVPRVGVGDLSGGRDGDSSENTLRNTLDIVEQQIQPDSPAETRAIIDEGASSIFQSARAGVGRSASDSHGARER